MNKKLLVSAMGLALAGGMSFANADVQLYGQLDVSVDYEDIDNGQDDVNMGANRSAVGVKGSEDLGNGLKAMFQMEWQVDVDDADAGSTRTGSFNEDESGSGNFIGRDQWIGLGGGFGKLRFGAISTAYKSPGSKIDPFYRTRIQSRNTGLQSTLHKGKGEEGEGRATNTIRYDTPNWNGLTGTATFTIDNDKNSGPGGDEDDNPWSAGLIYSAHGLYAFGSYITTNGGSDDAAYQVGAKYTIGGFSVRGIYEWDDGLITLNQGGSAAAGSSNEGSGDSLDVWSVGADYKIANNLISVDYGQAQNSSDNTVATGNLAATNGVISAGNGVAVDNYVVWRVGAQHMFSKRTKVYLGYANNDGDDSCCGEDEILTVGMRHKF